MHISLRLAWHDDGWNGHICKSPEKNTYCIGHSSYPGDVIKGERDLQWESRSDIKGKPCHNLDYSKIACAYSCNAFGGQNMQAISKPPIWFRDGSTAVPIDIPPSTACVWNYEGMYSDDVNRELGNGQKFNYDTRLEKAKEYFARLEEGKSLIFYYANYSNPFSEGDNPSYVVVGISRLKKTGKIHYYENVSEENKRKYAGGFVWQMPLTSSYPEEGFCLPYHKYRNNPEVLERITFIPQNPRNFKYATREIIEDDALALVERFIEIVNYLIEIGDNTQDWEKRRQWLFGLLAELWKDRGEYPGLPGVLKYLDFPAAIEYYRTAVGENKAKEAILNIVRILNGEINNLQNINIGSKQLREIQRNWALLSDEQQQILISIVPRFAMRATQIEHILSTDSERNGILSSLKDIIENPYILCEQYYGDDPDDTITFNTIDYGVLPSPELGLENIFTKNSKERFRALCVDILRKENTHSFLSQTTVLFHINNKLSYLPEWKTHIFTPKYLQFDAEFLGQALVIKKCPNNETYIYLQQVYQDEKCIESHIRQIQQRPDIKLKVHISEGHFCGLLRENNSALINNAPKEYEEAIIGQAKVCQKVFNKPICVIAGAAGTGKTTILKAIISSIEKAHGVGTGIILLAPTGKAAERLRERTGREASTVHSFLAQRGWLNNNLNIKRSGGKIDSSITTVIIDECSMIDLTLFAALFRAISWAGVQRLIFVGDPNQIPPIGRGKVFNDIITWMISDCPGNLGKLDINVRQLENRVQNKGNGILELAELYIQEKQHGDGFDKANREQMLKKIQQGGAIDKDLSVRYWNNIGDLELVLKDEIMADLANDTQCKVEPNNICDAWVLALKGDADYRDVSYLQVLSPFRGEYFGVDYLNVFYQELLNSKQAKRKTLDGIALYDKILQYRNRPKSDKISAYSWTDRKPVKIEIYNGEIGFAVPHPLDKSLNKCFCGKYSRLNDFNINYGYKAYDDGKVMFNEPIEENLELGYVISIHKAQGSEFNRVYLILPKRNSRLLSMELMYTAITRAKHHLTIFAQTDVSTFIELSQIGKSSINRINSSVFNFSPLPDELFKVNLNWYEDEK